MSGREKVRRTNEEGEEIADTEEKKMYGKDAERERDCAGLMGRAVRCLQEEN